MFRSLRLPVSAFRSALLCGAMAMALLPFWCRAQGIPVTTYFEQAPNVIREQYFLLDSSSAQLHGEYRAYLPSGQLEVLGYYRHNQPDSIWSYYYLSGKLKMQGPLREGRHHGLWTYYFENGQVSMRGRLYGETRQGPWQYYYENGKLKSEGSYRDDRRDGIWNHFYEDGTLKAQAFYRDGRGKQRDFYVNGALKAEGIQDEGSMDSLWTFYHENGKIKAQGMYRNGLQEGSWTFYHANGLRSAEGPYRSGKQEGKWTYYHDNGTLSSEGALRENEKEGYWRIFNEQGSFIGEGIFERSDGRYTEYYPSGKIRAEGPIEDGQNHGLWRYYYEDGVLEGECPFAHGSGTYTGYYKDGSIKMNGQIENGVNVGIWKLYRGDGELAGYYRPYYENNKPLYRLIDESDTLRSDYTKPAYRFKNTKVRYFVPVVNEYRGFILGTNPAATILGSLPIAAEYYIQERLGYELQINLLRDPFFKSGAGIDNNIAYKRGFDVALRQKLYSPEGDIGMFYFGHEVRLTFNKHLANTIDSTNQSNPVPRILTAKETKFEYSVLIGNRWMTLYGERWRRNSVGVTIDTFMGLGIGYRFYQEQFPATPEYQDIFKGVNQSKFAFSPRLGINIGFIF
jgi:uncharacterized protein